MSADDVETTFQELQTAGLHQVRMLDAANQALARHLSDDLALADLLALTQELRQGAALALAYSHSLLPLRQDAAVCQDCAEAEEDTDA